MCGVAGFVGDFPAERLLSMAKMIEHRGPDDEGFWQSDDGRVGLAHRRLSIIDLSMLGHQPMRDEMSGVVLIYNGEIYNFRELRRELEALGHSFRSQSDTEVLLKGLVQFGKAWISRLNGIFAFAAYDPRDRTVLLARDHFGVKPLYIARSTRGVLFASELKALLTEPTVSRELDANAIAAYLTYLWSPGERTPLRSVQKLLPGSLMILTEHGTSSSRYFRSHISEQMAARSDAELCDELDSRLGAAVHRQMVADVPVGAFLSGGLDSSAIVHYAARNVGHQSLECFTIDPRGSGMAEEGMTADLPYAQRVARHIGVNLHVVPIDSSIVRNLPRALFHLDEPQADPAAINVLMIAELARSRDIKVLLSGTAGDDLFAGYRRHWAQQAERYWRWLPAPMLGAAARYFGTLGRMHPVMRRIAKALRHSDAQGDDRLISYLFWLDPQRVGELLEHSEVAQQIGAPLREELKQHGADTRGLNRLLALEQAFFLPDHNLNYTDKLAMAHGVEVRVPFLDLELAEFANGLPLRVKQRGRTGKWILKKTMERHLPHDVIYRPKTGFGAPLRHWLLSELAEWLQDTLSAESLRRRGLFRAEAVTRLIEEFRAGRVDAAYTLFALASIELWCRMFVDLSVPRPLT